MIADSLWGWLIRVGLVLPVAYWTYHGAPAWQISLGYLAFCALVAWLVLDWRS